MVVSMPVLQQGQRRMNAAGFVLTCPGCLDQKFLHLICSELFDFFYTLTALTSTNASCKGDKAKGGAILFRLSVIKTVSG